MRNAVTHDRLDAWSAGSLKLPNGGVRIVLNPNHPRTRKCATLMEELSHVHLGHTPTQLILIDGGPAIRTFKKSYETEAYWVGSAALLPRPVLEFARAKQTVKADLAEQYGVSRALVTFRERVTGIIGAQHGSVRFFDFHNIQVVIMRYKQEVREPRVSYGGI